MGVASRQEGRRNGACVKAETKEERVKNNKGRQASRQVWWNKGNNIWIEEKGLDYWNEVNMNKWNINNQARLLNAALLARVSD